jgi:hypothetical protein
MALTIPDGRYTTEDAVRPLYHPTWGNWWPVGPGSLSERQGVWYGEGENLSGPVSLGSRRKPWPYDLIVNGHGVICRPQDEGIMVGRKMQALQGVAPITYEYGSQPVYAERTYAFRKIFGGYGERTQSTVTPRRYFYALNADLSVGGLQMKGPLFHQATKLAAGPVRWLLDAVDPALVVPPDYPDGWPKLVTFAGAGQLVLKCTGPNAGDWVVSKDLGSYDPGDGGGIAPDEAVKAVRFWPAGTESKDTLLVVTRSGALWGTTDGGATWTKGEQQAFSVTVLRDELWIADGRNTIRSCTADPLVAANWGAQITVGDASQAITNLEVLDDTLYAFKTNGIFTLGVDGSGAPVGQDKFPSFRQQPLPRNGVNAAPWLGRLWFGYGDSYYWLDNAGVLQPTGPNLLMENNSEVAGEVTAFAGHAAWFGYYGLWHGPAGGLDLPGDSFLVKHGTWLNPEAGETGDYRFDEVANGAVAVWRGRKITTLYVSDALRGNARLYAGFADGSIDWCLLPRGTPNPAHPDSGCEFTDQESWVYWPLHHAMFQADAKHYRGFSVFGPMIDRNNTVEVEYRLNHAVGQPAPTGSFVPLGATFEFSGHRVELKGNIFGYAIEVRHQLVSGGPAPTTHTPVLEGIALHEAVRPALQLEYTWTVNARQWLARRDGVMERRTPWQTRQAMLEAAAATGAVEVYVPDEGIQALTVVDYAEALAPVTKRYGAEWDISMKGVQFRTATVYGTWDRVGMYDWDTVAQYTWDDVLFL